MTRWRWLVLAAGTGSPRSASAGDGCDRLRGAAAGSRTPGSGSAIAYERINQEFGNQDVDLLVLCPSDRYDRRYGIRDDDRPAVTIASAPAEPR